MTQERGAPLRTAGSIAGAVFLAIVALALHPHLSGHAGPQAELRQLDSLGARDRLVHGTLLLLLGVLLTGFASYSLHRGLSRLPVLAGLVSFALGIGGLFAAGLIDGFVLPEIVARFVAASTAAQDAAVATIAAAGVAVIVLSMFGIVALTIAIAAWSLDLARDVGESRIAGIVGFVSALLTGAVLVTGGSSLTPHTLIAVLCVQGVWYVWIAVLLASGKPH
jgi:hypothetical protein